MRITILVLIRVHRRERTVRGNGGNGKVGKLATLDPSMRLLLCVAVSLVLQWPPRNGTTGV